MAVYNNIGILDESTSYNWDSDMVDATIFENTEDPASLIIIQTEKNWNTMMKAVGLAELSEIESTGDVIYESGKASGFIAAVKKFFKNIFSKIAALFKAIGLRLFNGCKDAKDFCDKYKKEIGRIEVPDDFEYKSYEYTNLDTAFTFKDKDENLAGISTAKPGDSTWSIYEKANKESDTLTDLVDKERGSLLKQSDITASDWSSEVKKYFRNGEDDTSMIGNVVPSNIVSTITNGSKIKDVLDKDFKNYKNSYDNLEKQLNKIESDFEKDKDDNYDTKNQDQKDAIDFQIRAIKGYIDIVKERHKCLADIYQAQMDALNERNKTLKSVLITLINKTTFAKTKSKVDENAEFGVSHYNSFIDNISFT